MLIKIVYDGKRAEKCSVVASICPLLSCFHPARERHTAAAGYSGCSAWTGTKLVCGRRDAQGCPQVPIRASSVRYVRLRGVWRMADPIIIEKARPPHNSS